MGGRLQRLIPATIAGGGPGLCLTGRGLRTARRKARTMNSDARTLSLLEQHWKASSAGITTPSTRSTPKTRSWTIPSPVNASTAGRRSRRSAAGIRLSAISPSCGSVAAVTCGSARS